MSALALRIVAMVCMLLDHLGYCLAGRYPFLEPLRWIGRIAFPLYVFLIVNGFRHTSSRLRYALRLLIFTVISQLPYAMLFQAKHGVFYSFNVFFTLLLALLVVWATDALRGGKVTRWFTPLPTLIVFSLYYFNFLHSDYGAKGILLAMVFYLFDGKKVLTALGLLASVYYSKLIALAASLLHVLRGGKMLWPTFTAWELKQLFSLLALVFIFLYNGKRGALPQKPAARKAVQLGFYVFYPAHLCLLILLFRTPLRFPPLT